MNLSYPIINNTQTITPNYQYICNLNQIDLLNQVNKLPQQAYWFLITATIILTLYIFIPKLQEKIKPHQIMFPIYMLLISALWIYTFITFEITQEIYAQKIEPYIWIGFATIILILIWRERKKLKEIFKGE